MFVVRVSDHEQVVRTGSGVAIAEDLVVTNKHVVGTLRIGRRFVEVTQGNKSWLAYPMFYSPTEDLCLLHVPGLRAKAAVLCKTSSLRVGAKVFAVGAPKGLELTLTDGLVSAVRQGAAEGAIPRIQTSAPISPGSSGGGLFDSRGKLVGVTTAFVPDSQGLGFAVPSESVAALLPPSQLQSSLHLVLGTAYCQARNIEKARQAFAKATELSPRNAQAWLARGDLGPESFSDLVSSGEHKYACYSRAVEADPLLADAWLALGKTQQDQVHSLDINASIKTQERLLVIRSVTAIEKACQLDPANADAWLALASVYRDAEQYEAGIRACDEALRLKPGWLEALTELCRLYAGSSQLEPALRTCQKVLDVAPQNTEGMGYAASAWVYLESHCCPR